jgi:hypothetical protein
MPMIELAEATGAGLLTAVDWVVGNPSLVSALATVAIAWLTFELARENRKLRKAGQEPQVVAYLVPHPDGNGAINIVFANIGLGLAKDVVFNIVGDEEDFKAHKILLKTLRGAAPINVIPSGEKIVALFGVGFELFGNLGENPIEPLKPFTVKMEFSDINGKRRSTLSDIDIRQFSGLTGLMNRPALREIEGALKSMDKRFDIIARAAEVFVNHVDTSSMEDQIRQFRKGDAPSGEPSETAK